MSDGAFVATSAAVVAVVVALVAALFGMTWVSPDGAVNTVVRNGGLFDNKQVQKVVPAGTGTTYAGLWSSEHPYQASPFYWTTDGSDQGSSQTVLVTTRDGQRVGIEGRINARLTSDPAKLAKFDDIYGNRTFAGKYAWDGQDGFNAFLDSFMPASVQNVMSQVGRGFNCTDLNAQCAQAKGLTGIAQVDTTPYNAALQDQIEQRFAGDVNNALGGDFIEGVSFQLTRVTLDDKLQTAVNDAASAIAGANAQTVQAQAKVAAAKADADANAERQRGYANCPACGAIDQTNALANVARSVQPGATFIPGNTPVLLGAGK